MEDMKPGRRTALETFMERCKISKRPMWQLNGPSNTRVALLSAHLDQYGRIFIFEIFKDSTWEVLMQPTTSNGIKDTEDAIASARDAEAFLTSRREVAERMYAALDRMTPAPKITDDTERHELVQIIVNHAQWARDAMEGTGSPINKLVGAVRWLLDDITDAGENQHPDAEPGDEEYDSVANMREALAQYDGTMPTKRHQSMDLDVENGTSGAERLAKAHRTIGEGP